MRLIKKSAYVIYELPLSMPMQDVIDRMVYQGPKDRSALKYSFGLPNWDRADAKSIRDYALWADASDRKKSLNESKWYYCDCSVWCKCVECFCHKTWPDVEN